MIPFEELLKKTRSRDPKWKVPNTLLCLDPGHTTGVAVFRDGRLTDCPQVQTVADDQLLWQNLLELFAETQPTRIVCEDYKIYAHKLKQHTNASVWTLRLIGGIDLWAHMHNIPITYQMASMAKGFCQDGKLKRWGFWATGMRHSRDAIRHGCYYLLFGKGDNK